ncbi:hypothetical protein [Flavobacterium sp.]|jgi:hypothetical protein|uniref:hypothetical protein n=1 Tax=Flavobacterium sp. TaxID=239 RepID=UPI0037C029C2
MKSFDLENSPKIKSGFKVPDGYFEEFNAILTEQLAIEVEPKVISFHSRKKVWYSAIAAILLFAISVKVYQNWKVNSSPQLNQDEIENFLSYHPSITTEDLITLLNEEDILAFQKSKTIESDTIENYLLTTESLEYYLID